MRASEYVDRHGMRAGASLVRDDFELALKEFREADARYAGQPELLFWRCLVLLSMRRTEAALPHLKELFEKDGK